MSFFRNVVLNFKNKDDVEEYLEKYQELVPTQKGVGLEDFFICRLSDTSLLIFCTIDTEENGKKIIEFADEWRKENKFQIRMCITSKTSTPSSINFFRALG